MCGGGGVVKGRGSQEGPEGEKGSDIVLFQLKHFLKELLQGEII